MANSSLSRRSILQFGAGLAGLIGTAGAAFAQGKTKPIKVASIYTVPVEQQWVSRLHKALNAAKDRGDITYKWSENVANNDYERIMRQYSEEGTDLVVGEIFGVERAARRVAASYPKVAYLMGSSFGPVKPNLSVFDNFIHEPSYLTGMVAGQSHEIEYHRHGRRLRHPRGESPDAGVHGGREVGQSERQVPRDVHQLLVRPAEGEGSRLRDDRSRRRRDVRGALRRVRCREGKGREGDRQRDRHLRAISWHGAGERALAHGADRSTAPSRRCSAARFEAIDYGPFSFMAHGGASLVMDEKLVPADVVKLVKEKEKEIKDGMFRVNINDAEPKSS